MDPHPARSSSITVRYRGAWMQKHPSPSHSGSDFHWHPADVPPSVRVGLAELLTRYRGARTSLWLLSEEHVVWARTFSAVAPGDRRRYTGLAATVATPDERPWHHALTDILTRMPLPPAGPCTEAEDAQIAGQAARFPVPEESAPAPPVAVTAEQLGARFAPTQIAQAVYLGGPTFCTDPHQDDLPVAFAQLLSWLPPEERAHPRQGAFMDHHPANEISASTNRGLVNLLHYLTLAWFCPADILDRESDFPVQAWQLVLELSASLGRSTPDLLADLGTVAAAWDTTDDLRSYLLGHRILTRDQVASCDDRAPRPLFADSVRDAGWLWNRIMHYWGRALLPASDEELSRLAALLAQRIAVDHLFHLDAPDRVALPRRYLRRLIYESLLPDQRRALMMRALARYVPSLFQHPEVPFG